MNEDMDDDVLIGLAISSFVKGRSSSSSEPDYYASSVEQFEGVLYVVLRNYNSILGVFEVVGHGNLRKVSKIPKELRQ